MTTQLSSRMSQVKASASVALAAKVIELNRICIGNLYLDIPLGTIRELTIQELDKVQEK